MVPLHSVWAVPVMSSIFSVSAADNEGDEGVSVSPVLAMLNVPLKSPWQVSVTVPVTDCPGRSPAALMTNPPSAEFCSLKSPVVSTLPRLRLPFDALPGSDALTAH